MDGVQRLPQRRRAKGSVGHRMAAALTDAKQIFTRRPDKTRSGAYPGITKNLYGNVSAVQGITMRSSHSPQGA
ncbi:hypothetical protein KCP73_18430 [Salmonella enterica subsp. enterica]|nr:hypothetical protein KCP73_18430 [Salmonella enterica subsp. enterica]